MFWMLRIQQKAIYTNRRYRIMFNVNWKRNAPRIYLGTYTGSYLVFTGTFLRYQNSLHCYLQMKLCSVFGCRTLTVKSNTEFQKVSEYFRAKIMALQFTPMHWKLNFCNLALISPLKLLQSNLIILIPMGCRTMIAFHQSSIWWKKNKVLGCVFDQMLNFKTHTEKIN